MGQQDKTSHLQGIGLAVSIVLAASIATAAWAQTGSPLEGFATDPNAPIEIESDRLDVNDKAQTAIFTGNVVSKQGDTIMRSDSLKAVYTRTPDAAPAEPAPAEEAVMSDQPAVLEGEEPDTGNPLGTGSTEITDIYAYGNVHVTSKDDQSADGQWAHYVVATRNIEMGDRVVLRQKENVIRGAKLYIDLNSGKSRIASGSSKSGPGGRVKGLFQAPPDEKKTP
jgi:lipopolysaccharide export system protein LptA